MAFLVVIWNWWPDIILWEEHQRILPLHRPWSVLQLWCARQLHGQNRWQVETQRSANSVAWRNCSEKCNKQSAPGWTYNPPQRSAWISQSDQSTCSWSSKIVAGLCRNANQVLRGWASKCWTVCDNSAEDDKVLGAGELLVPLNPREWSKATTASQTLSDHSTKVSTIYFL